MMLDPRMFDPGSFSPVGGFGPNAAGWLNDLFGVPANPQGSFGELAPVPAKPQAQQPPLSIDEIMYGRLPAPRGGDNVLPPNATLTSGRTAAPPAAPMALAPPAAAPKPAEIGLLDRLSAASNNLSAKPTVAGLFDAFKGLSSGTRTDPQGVTLQAQNMTARALVNKGVPPEIAMAAASNPEILKQLLPAFGPKAYQFQKMDDGTLLQVDPSGASPAKILHVGGGKMTDDIAEFEYAQKQGFKGGIQDWMQRKRSGAGEYGLQPVWGVDAEGNPAVMQLGKGGEAIKSKIPADFKIARDPIKIDAGTEYILLDPQTRQPVGRQPKNVAATAAQEKIGGAQGDAAANLPAAIGKAELALKTIDQIRKHPGKDSFGAVGTLGWLPPVPGTDTKGFVSLLDQAKGQAFLQAFESIKGGGAITETEGLKATQAIARLDRTQSKKDFDQALVDLESVIKVGVERMRQKAGGLATGGAGASGAPKPDPLGLR